MTSSRLTPTVQDPSVSPTIAPAIRSPLGPRMVGGSRMSPIEPKETAFGMRADGSSRERITPHTQDAEPTWAP